MWGAQPKKEEVSEAAKAADFIKEKKTRRLATKAAIAMGVVILLVVGLNAGLTAAIVFLSKDVKVTNGKLTDPATGKPLQVDSASTVVASDGTLRDRTSNIAISTASALQQHGIDSRLPDEAWQELKYIDVRNDNGGSVHLFIQRLPPLHPTACSSPHPPSSNVVHNGMAGSWGWEPPQVK